MSYDARGWIYCRHHGLERCDVCCTDHRETNNRVHNRVLQPPRGRLTLNSPMECSEMERDSCSWTPAAGAPLAACSGCEQAFLCGAGCMRAHAPKCASLRQEAASYPVVRCTPDIGADDRRATARDAAPPPSGGASAASIDSRDESGDSTGAAILLPPGARRTVLIVHLEKLHEAARCPYTRELAGTLALDCDVRPVVPWRDFAVSPLVHLSRGVQAVIVVSIGENGFAECALCNEHDYEEDEMTPAHKAFHERPPRAFVSAKDPAGAALRAFVRSGGALAALQMEDRAAALPALFDKRWEYGAYERTIVHWNRAAEHASAFAESPHTLDGKFVLLRRVPPRECAFGSAGPLPPFVKAPPLSESEREYAASNGLAAVACGSYGAGRIACFGDTQLTAPTREAIASFVRAAAEDTVRPPPPARAGAGAGAGATIAPRAEPRAGAAICAMCSSVAEMQCTRCRKRAYCSNECRALDKPFHKATCVKR